MDRNCWSVIASHLDYRDCLAARQVEVSAWEGISTEMVVRVKWRLMKLVIAGIKARRYLLLKSVSWEFYNSYKGLFEDSHLTYEEAVSLVGAKYIRTVDAYQNLGDFPEMEVQVVDRNISIDLPDVFSYKGLCNAMFELAAFHAVHYYLDHENRSTATICLMRSLSNAGRNPELKDKQILFFSRLIYNSDIKWPDILRQIAVTLVYRGLPDHIRDIQKSRTIAQYLGPGMIPIKHPIPKKILPEYYRNTIMPITAVIKQYGYNEILLENPHISLRDKLVLKRKYGGEITLNSKTIL